jgi:hypothetical protein
LRRIKNRPWSRKVAWDGPPLGLETAAPCQPRAALAVRAGKTLEISITWSFRRGTGRLNATQPEI